MTKSKRNPGQVRSFAVRFQNHESDSPDCRELAVRASTEPEAKVAIEAVFGITPKRMRAGKTLSESELADYYPLSGGVWSVW